MELQEKMKKEREERERKEALEEERRQRAKLEAEQKRQAELEKQRQQQLEMEREQEALKKKMIQQRLVRLKHVHVQFSFAVKLVVFKGTCGNCMHIQLILFKFAKIDEGENTFCHK